eukprot:NODE_726_length_2415_cov_33.626091_g623_i0.p1 GENE.NODE_726_length_2415_cov_33.626091_g623_i0~~NODE_726_length_2415_cov_33.626091_g623_i0.p1  ORF type:complete len:676 (+),score=174.69 NODE_726_length_2415_cov_33.626091_g623_i0:65-2092(+)
MSDEVSGGDLESQSKPSKNESKLDDHERARWRRRKEKELFQRESQLKEKEEQLDRQLHELLALQQSLQDKEIQLNSTSTSIQSQKIVSCDPSIDKQVVCERCPSLETKCLEFEYTTIQLQLEMEELKTRLLIQQSQTKSYQSAFSQSRIIECQMKETQTEFIPTIENESQTEIIESDKDSPAKIPSTWKILKKMIDSAQEQVREFTVDYENRSRLAITQAEAICEKKLFEANNLALETEKAADEMLRSTQTKINLKLAECEEVSQRTVADAALEAQQMKNQLINSLKESERFVIESRTQSEDLIKQAREYATSMLQQTQIQVGKMVLTALDEVNEARNEIANEWEQHKLQMAIQFAEIKEKQNHLEEKSNELNKKHTDIQNQETYVENVLKKQLEEYNQRLQNLNEKEQFTRQLTEEIDDRERVADHRDKLLSKILNKERELERKRIGSVRQADHFNRALLFTQLARARDTYLTSALPYCNAASKGSTNPLEDQISNTKAYMEHGDTVKELSSQFWITLQKLLSSDQKSDGDHVNDTKRVQIINEIPLLTIQEQRDVKYVWRREMELTEEENLYTRMKKEFPHFRPNIKPEAVISSMDSWYKLLMSHWDQRIMSSLLERQKNLESVVPILRDATSRLVHNREGLTADTSNSKLPKLTANAIVEQKHRVRRQRSTI